MRAFYEDAGVAVRPDPDQDSHDLDKALQAVLDHHAAQCAAPAGGGAPASRVLIWGAFTESRFDHVMSGVDALYRWAAHFPGGLVLLSR